MIEEVIPILRVSDATSAAAWYSRLGFQQEWVHRFEPGLPAFVSLARGSLRLFLSEHQGDGRPGSAVYLRFEDVGKVAAEFAVKIHKQPWAHEVTLYDPDQNRITIGTPTS